MAFFDGDDSDISRMLARENDKIKQFIREAEESVEQMNFRISGSVNDTLEKIVQQNLRQFSKLFEDTLRNILQDAFSRALQGTDIQSQLNGSLGGSTSGLNRRGVISTLQRGAEIISVLNRSERNL